jgi:hypothetical protein
MKKSNSHIVKVVDLISTPYPSFHKEGLTLQAELSKAIRNESKVLVSFEGVKRCSTQFLNASFGVVYIDFSQELIDAYVSVDFAGVKNLEDKLNLVKENALMSEEYDNIVHEAY